MGREHIHFVTGRLAARALRATVEPLAAELQFDWTIDVLPITVAALMSPKWISPRLSVPPEATRVVVPGYCEGDLQPVADAIGRDVERGPRDLRQLPKYLGAQPAEVDYGAYNIQIVAEINHAPRQSLPDILAQAQTLAADGADLIDVGCDPGETWNGVSDCVRAIRDLGLRVSVDSLNPLEIGPAVDAGAELVLSVNSSNREAAPDWGCEVIAIPDDPTMLVGLDDTIDFLATRNVPLRIDAILEPIGFGFAESLGRYLDVRRRYPDAEMLMGIGNLTELTDVDSAGVNVLLLGFCEEVGIRSVLTTQVINWARTSVRECDLARRLVRHALAEGVPPKHLEPDLVVLRDAQLRGVGEGELNALAADIKDNNYRLFAEDGAIHLLSSQLHLTDRDPFALFEALLDTNPKNVDASHAFYLGFEMAKALTALQLGKQYQQDESLDWGHLTVEEKNRRLKFRREGKGR